MLKLNNLTCLYQQHPMRFSFSVRQEQRVAIFGPSGAGKSTLLNMIAGFLPITEGELWIAETRVTHQPPARRPLSILFQDNNLFTHLTVRQNLAIGLHPGLRLTPQQTRQLEQMAERTGLGDLLSRLPAQLSGGQRQRIALTRCLLRQRPLLLLDEPFSALDPVLRHEMLSLTEELCQEHRLTLLLVSHNLDDARKIADKSLIIDQGRVSWFGDTTALLSGKIPQAEVLGIAPTLSQQTHATADNDRLASPGDTVIR